MVGTHLRDEETEVQVAPDQVILQATPFLWASLSFLSVELPRQVATPASDTLLFLKKNNTRNLFLIIKALYAPPAKNTETTIKRMKIIPNPSA